jgi:hypothetical protein
MNVDAVFLWCKEFSGVFCTQFLDSINRYSNLFLVIVTAFMFWATRRSAEAAEKSVKVTKEIADDTKKAGRPYLAFCKTQIDQKDCFYLEGSDHIKFPYVLQNTGRTAAIEVKRNHYVVRERADAGKIVLELVEYLRLNEKRFECSVVPEETSPVHIDNVYFRSAKDNVEKFRIVYHIEYKSDIPNDDRCFAKIVTFELLPHPGLKIDANGDKYVLTATRLIKPTVEEKRPNEEGCLFDTKEIFLKKNGDIKDCCP